jgi:hypothetical protein
MVLALVPWMNSAASSRVSFFDQEAPPPTSECGTSPNQGPSLDDPSVDTDPDRPVTEHASMSDDEGDDSGDEGDDSSDDNADGMCRSETLELWFQPEPNTFVEARLATAATDS